MIEYLLLIIVCVILLTIRKFFKEIKMCEINGEHEYKQTPIPLVSVYKCEICGKTKARITN